MVWTGPVPSRIIWWSGAATALLSRKHRFRRGGLLYLRRRHRLPGSPASIVGLGDSVAVVGLGPVGMAAAYFALRAGALVIGLDTVESRRVFAGEIGIPFVLDPADHDALADVGAATGGRGATVSWKPRAPRVDD